MKIQCPYCKAMFEPNHGNRIYCSGRCYKAFNTTKQRENNAIIKSLSKGFLKNYKLFLSLLPGAGRKKVRVVKLLKTGFDQDASYGTEISKDGVHWHKVNEYLFSVIKLSDGDLILDLFKR